MCRQRLPQLWQQPLPISRPRRPALLKLHNVPPNVPIGLRLNGSFPASTDSRSICTNLSDSVKFAGFTSQASFNCFAVHPSALQNSGNRSFGTKVCLLLFMVFPARIAQRSQILNLELAIAFVVVAHVDAFHVQRAVVDLVGQGAFEQVFDLQVFHHATLHGG